MAKTHPRRSRSDAEAARVSRPLALRARGPLACFTRPELKVERVSYEVMTPSAARGVLEAILWKPAIRWRVHAIAALAPVQWISLRRNEVRDVASPRVPHLFPADRDQRSQRHTLALRDVDYVVHATFELTDRAGTTDSVAKFEDMFARRLERGRWFEPPYLGMREMVADVEPAPEPDAAVAPDGTRALGLMFYDFAPAPMGAGQPLFFEAQMTGGVVQVPPLARVLVENGVWVSR